MVIQWNPMEQACTSKQTTWFRHWQACKCGLTTWISDIHLCLQSIGLRWCWSDLKESLKGELLLSLINYRHWVGCYVRHRKKRTVKRLCDDVSDRHYRWVCALTAMPSSLALWCCGQSACLAPCRPGFESRWGDHALPSRQTNCTMLFEVNRCRCISVGILLIY